MTRNASSEDGFVSWRPGVDTRMRISALTGARSLCIFDQRVAPECGAPLHTHRVEEALYVLAGRAEIRVGEATILAEAGDVTVVPAEVAHSFVNIGDCDLLITAVLASATFEAVFGEDHFVRRWSEHDEGSTVVATENDS